MSARFRFWFGGQALRRPRPSSIFELRTSFSRFLNTSCSRWDRIGTHQDPTNIIPDSQDTRHRYCPSVIVCLQGNAETTATHLHNDASSVGCSLLLCAAVW